MAAFDAVIIGGGHNGLVCANYLAKAGLSVAVVEQKKVIGGCVVTAEAIPGWKVNTYSFEHYVIQNTPILQELELGKFGLRYYEVDPTVFSPYKDGAMMLFYRDLRKTLGHIASFSQHDARAYEKFHERWSKLSRALGVAAARKPMAFEEIIKTSGEFAEVEKEELLQEILLPASTILKETFETEYLASPIAFLGPAAVGQSPENEGTGWLLAWHLGAERLARPLGGSGRLSEALGYALRSHGGVIMTGEKVSEILTTGEKVVGIKTEKGRVLESELVISNADPKQTLLDLVRHMTLSRRELDHIRAIKVHPGFTFKADYLLSELPTYHCKQGAVPNDCHRAATFIAPSPASLASAFGEYERGLNPKEPGLMVAFHSTTDSSLVPSGKHCLTLETRYTPYRLDNIRDWKEEDAEKEAARLLELFSQYCSPLAHLVEHSVFMSPQDMERDLLLPEGNFMHADMIFTQMFERRPAAGLLDGYAFRPIKGLYLCGAGTHPGGSVSGLPGRNAAMQILENIRQ